MSSASVSRPERDPAAGSSLWPPGEEVHTCRCTDRSKELHYSYQLTQYSSITSGESVLLSGSECVCLTFAINSSIIAR